MGSTKFPVVPPPQGGTPALPGPGQPAPMRPDEYHPGSIPNLVSFAFDKVSPPTAVYVQRDDNIRFMVASNVPAGETVTIVLRFLRVPEPRGGQPDQGGVGRTVGQVYSGGIISTEIEVIAPSTLSTVIVDRQYAEGFLLSIGARSANTSARGRTYVTAILNRLIPGLNPAALPLFADYVTTVTYAGWPGGRVLNPVEGPGWMHSLQQANPAAGADWTLTASARQRLRIITMEAQLAVANSGAARPVEIIVDDGANVVARMATNTAAAINATSFVNFSNAGTPSTSIATDLYAQMPAGLILEPGWRIRSNTTNIVAGDQWSNIWFSVEEWLEGI